MIAAGTLHRGPTAGGPVRLQRTRLRCSLGADAALSRLEGERLPFALTGRWAGGGAILGSEPVTVADNAADPFSTLDELPELAGGERTEAVGGGWFGWLGYRLSGRVERLPTGPPRPVALPEFHLAYYDHILRLDRAGQWWFEALVGAEREAALAARLTHLQELLAEPAPASGPAAGGMHPRGFPSALTLTPAAAERHLAAVAACVDRIAAGEIFQANLCLRLESSTERTATELFAWALARATPAYGAAFSTERGGVASLSPELFLRRRGPDVVTAPIKGTILRPYGAAGAAALRRLRSSVKDAAEHVMIVDLMRNDLGRVCAYGTIVADAGPHAEPHPGLWQLVSHVRGRLRDGVGNAELLRATFPPGSVTGAPKVQAMYVIASLEATGREVYTGAIGYCSPVAGLELSVAIRTLEMGNGALWLGVGGGIVSDSDPQGELEETLVKARPVAAAIGTTVQVDDAPGPVAPAHAD